MPGSDSIKNLCIDEPIRVLIAHSDAIVNAGLAALLAAQTDVHVSIAGRKHPASDTEINVVILDYRSAMAYIHRDGGACPRNKQPSVMIVTQLDSERDVSAAMTAGVHGYLLQSASGDQLLTAIRELDRGTRYLDTELTHHMDDSLDRICLTKREADVLHLLAQGMCNKLIARELGVGVGTVKTHVKGLFNKLGATARTHAVVLAMRRGLVGQDTRRPRWDEVHVQ